MGNKDSHEMRQTVICVLFRTFYDPISSQFSQKISTIEYQEKFRAKRVNFQNVEKQFL